MKNHKIRIADTFFTKFIGLMGNSSLALNEGLLLVNCNAIHTFFMLYPLSIIYLDDRFEIVKIVEHLKVNCFTRLVNCETH